LSTFESVDFFTDASLIPDPYPVLRPPARTLPGDDAIRTGRRDHQQEHREALAVYKDPAFSSCVSVAGPFSGCPSSRRGTTSASLIEAHRSQIPMSEHIVTQDAPEHTRTRGLLSRLLTPKRLKENEDFMWRLADAQLDEFVSGQL